MADYYVDKTNGSDSTGDGSSGNPWATLNYALTTGGATGGDTVHVANTSAQTGAVSLASITTSGTAPLVITGWDNGGSITADLLGEEVPAFEMDGESSTASAFTGTKNYVILRRCKIHGFTSSGWNNNGSFWRFLECEVFANGARGIYNASYARLYRCYAHDNSTEGIWAVGGIAVKCASIDNNYHGYRGLVAAIECIGSGISITAAFGMDSIGVVFRCSARGGAAGGVAAIEGYLNGLDVWESVISKFDGASNVAIKNTVSFTTHGFNALHSSNGNSFSYLDLDIGGGVSESSDPFEGAASDDFRLVSGASAKGAAPKGPSENAEQGGLGAIQGVGGVAASILAGGIYFGL